MTREEFGTLAKAMKAVYTDPKFLPDKDAFDVWYSMLADLPYRVAHEALRKFMMTEKFPPTIADIRAKASEFETKEMDSISELQAWNLVVKAIRNSGYNAEDEFNKLPPECQLAVGNPSALREWALMDSDQVHTVQQSHFIRSFRAVRDRARVEARLPEQMRMLKLGPCREELPEPKFNYLPEIEKKQPTEQEQKKREQMIADLRKRLTSET